MTTPLFKGITGRLNNLRLGGKMMLTFLCFGFIPLLLASIIQLNALVEVLRVEAEKEAADALEDMARRIDERFDTYNRIVNTIVFDTQLIKSVNQPYAKLSDAMELYYYVWNQANNIIRDNPDILFVSLYTQNPDLRTMPPYLICTDAIENIEVYAVLLHAFAMPYLSGIRTVSRRGDYWLKPVPEGEPVFALNRAMSHEPLYVQRPSGLLSLNIRETALRSLIETSDDNRVNFVVDQDGLIVTASDHSLRDTSIFSMVTPDEWHIAVSTGHYRVDAGSDRRLLVRPLQGRWMLGTIISMRDIYASTRSLQFVSITVISLCALLSMLLVAFISVATARRFDLLLQKMRVPATGIPEPGPPIEGRDEIGLLDERFRAMTVNLNDTVHELYRTALEKREAQLLALQSRINPHFLYNALSSISWMTRTHTPLQVREAIDNLATYYRAILSGGRDVITLGEELNGLRSYLAIQHLRGEGRVRAVITVDSALEGLMLPKMTIQPIVENCIKHGFDAETRSISIMITSAVDKDDALICIADDGQGIDPATLAQIRAGSAGASGSGYNSGYNSGYSGYGISNVQMRLKMHFGEAYGLTVENKERGVCVTIRIPLRE